MTDAKSSKSFHEETPGLSSQSGCLVENSLYVLSGSVPVDGRISWYSAEHLGRHVPFNSYLLKSGDKLLLLESGVPAVFATMASQLRSIVGEGAALQRIAVTRNEADCVSNVPHLVREFGLAVVHSPGLMNTLQFFPAEEIGAENSFNHRSTELQMLNFGVACVPAISGGEIEVSGSRALEVIAVPLRVLPTVWYYDRNTKSMFCSDSFSDETVAHPAVRSVFAVDEKEALVGRSQRHFQGKFDWLTRSDLTAILTDLESIFARYEIEILAPTRGAVIRGRYAVEAKVAAVMASLRELQAKFSTPA